VVLYQPKCLLEPLTYLNVNQKRKKLTFSVTGMPTRDPSPDPHKSALIWRIRIFRIRTEVKCWIRIRIEIPGRSEKLVLK
jgi:hypothetical protein